MITMQDFINNINAQKMNNLSTSVAKKENNEIIIKNNQDSFEKQETKKIDKKKVAKIGVIFAGVVTLATAIVKRKSIADFIGKIFKKSGDVMPSITKNIKSNKTNEIISAFPTPKFKSNPTVEQRDEYIKELLKFLNNKIGTQDKLKAFDEIKRYGISDIDLINFGLYDPDEKVIRKTLEIYQQYGSDKNVYQIIGLIRKDVVDIKEEQTFVELLKTIQKLANIKDDTLQEQRIITEPIKRLSNCENENVRKMAQETLDKIIK